MGSWAAMLLMRGWNERGLPSGQLCGNVVDERLQFHPGEILERQWQTQVGDGEILHKISRDGDDMLGVVCSAPD